MTDKNQYIHLGRLKDEKANDLSLDKISLENLLDTSTMPLKEKINFNLKTETWKNRLNYYALCVKNYFQN